MTSLLVFVLPLSARAAPLDPAAFVSLGALSPATPITIDTDVPEIRGGASFSGVVDGDVAVFAFDSVAVDADMVVVGARPVALLSRGDLRLGAGATLFAAGVGRNGGPGGFDGAMLTPGALPCEENNACEEVQGRGPGGGASNSDGAGGGAFGGPGGGSTWYRWCSDPTHPWYHNPGCDLSYVTNGGNEYGDPWLALIGGSGGAAPATYSPYYYFGILGGPDSAGGGGGGAVELGAVGQLTIEGTVDVRGAAGADTGGYWASPGGGAGGAVLVHGSGGSLAGSLFAGGGDAGPCYDNGGGGGGGGRITVSGLDTVTGTLDVSGGVGCFYSFDGGDGVVVIDTDGDSLDDDDELTLHGTDPLLADTDLGLLDDGVEVRRGTDPTWGGDDLPAPHLVFSLGPRDGLNVLRVDEMVPGYPVLLLSSETYGPWDVLPDCTVPTPVRVGEPWQVRDTALPDPGIGRIVHGVAELGVTLPPGFVGTRFLTAVQPATCRTSDTVELTRP